MEDSIQPVRNLHLKGNKGAINKKAFCGVLRVTAFFLMVDRQKQLHF